MHSKPQWLDGLFRPVRLFVVFILVAIFIEVISEVAFRYVLFMPLPWGQELARTLLAWLTFIGAALALYEQDHMRVMLVVNLLPRRGRQILGIIGLIAMLLFVLLGIHTGFTVVAKTWASRTTAMQIPAGVLYLSLPAGFVLMLPVLLRRLKPGNDPEGEEKE